MQIQEPGPELQLIERIKSGERAAFDCLVGRYKEKAFAVSYSMTGNYEDARDVLQEAFVRAYTNIKNFRGDSSFYTWFYRILINLCKDHLRRRQNRDKAFADNIKSADESGDAAESAVDDSRDPLEAVLDKEMQQILDKALETLPAKQKTVFILKHMQGMKLSEIARIINCSESTAKVHLFRATHKLQDLLSPYLLYIEGERR